MSDLFIQAIGFIPSVIAITALQSNNRKRILALQFLCSIMWFSHYWMLGAITFAMTNIINLLRAVICYYNDKDWAKSNWIPVGLCVLYILGTVFTWQGIQSIFPCIAMLMTTVALWIHDMKKTRLLFLLNSPLMFLADILAGSYSTAIIEVIAFTSFAIAVYRYDIKPLKKPILQEDYSA